ncbi:MAG TPA: A/G-specific adenine glycosylase [Methylophilaceae bacterium]|nr:A/G-specific adenine glycosylase [Methylophilaceae bacterium]HQR60062.1 A/G-specific adenine glycosylase [Methylophilaceae bacterium]
MSSFSNRIIAWQRRHGRHDLPWQKTRDPYAIWVSEIMLQQTQVAAVIPYYQRFMARFPDIASLAAADEDIVLQHWSGLGYYSRARNLHAAAQKLMNEFGGRFPQSPEAIQRLPGIGRSTAAAIAAFSFGHCGAILDGNVKRVLTRCFGVAGWPGQPAIEKRLWELAESLLPQTGIAAYTQGLMDLGASLCSRSKPACSHCPLLNECVAQRECLTTSLPSPKPRKVLPERATTMLLLLDGNDILLEKRPSTGVWGGLWSLPEVAGDGDAQHVARQRFGLETVARPAMPTLTHAFTHFRLHITPQPLLVTKWLQQGLDSRVVWLDIEDARGAALPTPVRRLLNQLRRT